MSEENVEKVREAWDAWTKGDPGALSVLDPEVVYDDDMLPDHAGETYHGPGGLLRAWARWAEPWETFETDLEWARDAGDEVVSCHPLIQPFATRCPEDQGCRAAPGASRGGVCPPR